MPREKEGFRDNMALLNIRFPEKDMLNKNDVAEFIGCSYSTVSRRIRFNPATRRVSKADLARQISL